MLSACSQGDRAPRWHPSQTSYKYILAREFCGFSQLHRKLAQQYEALWRSRADILVTHTAPSCHRYGFKELDELAAAWSQNSISWSSPRAVQRDNMRREVVCMGLVKLGLVTSLEMSS